MEELKKKIKIHSITMILIFLIWIIAVIAIFMIFSVNIKSLTSYCKVYNEDDLNQCFKENPYVEIHTKEIYDTGYDYTHNNKAVARFTNIIINDYWMISLMSNEKVKEISTNETDEFVIKGKLEQFDTKAKAKGYNLIKEEYVQEFKDEWTREEVMNNFTLVQFSEYNGDKVGLYIWAILGVGAIVLFIVFIIKQLKYVIHPEEYHFNDNLTLKDEKQIETILKELETPEYHEKNIYLTKHYLIYKTGVMQVAKRQNVAWIYEKIIKQNGITSGKSWIVYSLDRKGPMNFGSFGKKHTELGELLKKEFPDATFGFNEELSKEWNKHKEQFIKRNDR